MTIKEGACVMVWRFYAIEHSRVFTVYLYWPTMFRTVVLKYKPCLHDMPVFYDKQCAWTIQTFDDVDKCPFC